MDKKECTYASKQLSLTLEDTFRIGFDVVIFHRQPTIRIFLGIIALIIGPHWCCSECGEVWLLPPTTSEEIENERKA